MQFKLTTDQISALERAKISHPTVTAESWSSQCCFSSHQVTPEYLAKLEEFARKNQKDFNGVLQKLSIYAKVLKNPKANCPRRLDQLQAAIEQAAMVQAPNRWLFKADAPVPSPFLVTKVEYTPAKDETPADVTVSLSFSEKARVRTSSITYHQDNLKDARSVEELLLHKGYVFENEKLVGDYVEYLKGWEKKYKAHFKQFVYQTAEIPEDCDSDGEEDWRSWDTRNEATLLASEFRVVNDVPILKLHGTETTMRVPSLNRGRAEDGSDDDDTDVFEVPIHPWVYVFNLETHSHMWIEPHKMMPYVYEKDLVSKLILPKAHKSLIKLLTSNPDTLRADFVRGKSAGTIVMACGEPGLGKTMSAEAYAEGAGVILYRVQSDQLGLSPTDIEKNLKDVFARAERWGAVLLIDEADIYVRERGIDIKQNAIVGTLLRTLEYFNGIIFMTTNRATLIDDAIMSRCSAVIMFEYPCAKDATTIFNNFGKLFGMTLAQEAVQSMIASNPKLSGRSIKNILRLTARRGLMTPTLEDLEESKAFVR